MRSTTMDTETVSIIAEALKQTNEERRAHAVLKVKEIIRDINNKRDTIRSLQAQISDLQDELREMAPPEMLADNVLGD